MWQDCLFQYMESSTVTMVYWYVLVVDGKYIVGEDVHRLPCERQTQDHFVTPS